MYYGRPKATPHFQSGTNSDSSSVPSFYVLIIVYSILYRVKSAHLWPKNLLLVHNMFIASSKFLADSSKSDPSQKNIKSILYLFDMRMTLPFK